MPIFWLRSFILVWLGFGLWSLAGATTVDVERGRQLFMGSAPLAGRITGHSEDLPSNASRCANCHVAGPAPVLWASSAPSAALRPRLDVDGLTRDTRRRGGPPSHYDEQSFCRLLLTGVDPAHIMLPRSMPRYTMSSADCRALWLYLSESAP